MVIIIYIIYQIGIIVVVTIIIHNPIVQLWKLNVFINMKYLEQCLVPVSYAS